MSEAKRPRKTTPKAQPVPKTARPPRLPRSKAPASSVEPEYTDPAMSSFTPDVKPAMAEQQIIDQPFSLDEPEQQIGHLIAWPLNEKQAKFDAAEKMGLDEPEDEEVFALPDFLAFEEAPADSGKTDAALGLLSRMPLADEEPDGVTPYDQEPREGVISTYSLPDWTPPQREPWYKRLLHTVFG